MADVSGKFYSATKVRTGVSPSSPGIEQGATLEPVNPPGSAINSVGLTMPTAFNVANSPLTSNGTIAVTGAGTTAEYIRGDGSLASFPSLTGYVPYTGATQNVDLGEFGLDTGFVNLDTTPTSTPTTQGTMYWEDSRSTVALIMNGTLQHIGQDTFFYVKNASGSSIAKGTAVRFDGTDGASGHLLIAPFLANGTYPSNYFMGVTAETIASGSFGQVMHFGELSGINTSGYTAGALLYASTTVAGGFQTTAPVAPNNIVLIAAAINSKNNGEILVRPTYGSNINQDEGVKIVSPTTGQLLQLQSNGLWENKTKAQVLGGTSSQFVKGDGSLDSTTYQSTADKGQPNGYASLDSNGKVPLTQINDALIGNVNYQGLWNASTNTPTLANPPSSGTKGYYYIVSTAGTFAGISFEVGDWIISNGTAWQKVDNTDAVSSVFGRTGNVVAANGDYTTAQVTESGNLYFTQARVSANTDVAANTAARHNAVTLGSANGLSLSTQVLSLGLASAGVTGALSGTDWSTFNSKQNALTNPVTGTGTNNFLTKFTSTGSTVGNSQIYDAGGFVGINTTNTPTGLIGSTLVIRASSSNIGQSAIAIQGFNGTTRWVMNGQIGPDLYNFVLFSSTTGTSYTPRFIFTPDGNLGINNQGPLAPLSFENTTGNKIDFFNNGTARYTAQINTSELRIYTTLSDDIISLYAGNVVGLVNKNGRIGIAKVDPSVALDVNGAGLFSSSITASSIIRSGGTSSQYLMADGSVSTLSNPVTGTGTTNYLPKFTGSTTIGNSQVFDNGTNVGIGTNGPNQKLEVNGRIRVSSNGTNGGDMAVDDGGIAFSTQGATPIAFWRDNYTNHSIRISAAGRLLINKTNDEGFTLDVNGTGRFSGNLEVVKSSNPYLIINDSGVASTGGILFQPTGFNAKGGLTLNFATAEQRLFTGEGGNTYFQTFYTNGVERLRIASTGAATFSSSVTAAGIITANGGNIDGTLGEAILFGNASYPAAQKNRIRSSISASTNGNLLAFEAGNGTIGSYNNNQLVLRGDGNVGINTASPSARLSLGNLVSAQKFLMYDNNDNFKYGLGIQADEFRQFYPSNASLTFGTVSTSDGSTFAERMRITSGGNVGIGETNPSYKLHIVNPSASTFLGISNQGSNNGNRQLRLGFGGAGADTFASIQGTRLNVADDVNIAIQSGGGNVLIGTTTDNGNKLRVEGSGYFSSYLTVLGFSGLREVSGLYFSPNGLTVPEMGMYAASVSSIGFSTNTTPRLIITSGGNLLLGTTTDNSAKLTVFTGGTTAISGTNDGIRMQVSSYNSLARNTIAWHQTASNLNLGRFGIEWNDSNSQMNFVWRDLYNSGAGTTELMRLQGNGNLLIGTQTTIGPAAGRIDLLYSGLVQYGMNIRSSHTDGIAISFVNSSGTQVGTIYQNSSSTAYNTSSDYRLKTDLKEFNGVEIINKIKTYDFEWKTDKTRSYGVIAHELKEVIDYAVFGEKDSVTMQGVDYSKLVPIMVKAIQEQHQEITELKNKLS